MIDTNIHIPWMQNYNLSISQELRRYEELEIAVKQLTGYNFECLYRLFLMGYTLKPPEYDLPSNQIARIFEEETLCK